MNSFHLSHARTARRGVALVVVLSLIVLLTVLVVGYTVTARFNRLLSSGYSKADRTQLVALSALNHAKALLASNIPDVGPNAPTTPTHWWVAPGRLWTQSGNDTIKVINLYSGDSTGASDPNLNRALIDRDSNGNIVYPIEPTGTVMRVAWIPVGKDPSQSISSTNPMVARFAYWIDAENTRINLRTARVAAGTSTAAGAGVRSELAQATSTYVPAVRGSAFKGQPDGTGGIAPGSPRVADISGLTGANNITFTFDGGGYFQISNVREYRQFFPSDSAWDTFFNANKFDLSVWGESPEFTPFGKNRMTSVGGRNSGAIGFQFYWDLNDPNQMSTETPLLGSTNYPPGTGPTVNEYDYVLHSARALATAFQSTDWPGYSGTSLAAKWATRAGLSGVDVPQVAEQVAWNMMTLHAFTVRGSGIVTELFGLSFNGRTAAGTTAQPTATSDLFPSALSGSTAVRYLAQSGNPYVSELGLELNWETSGTNKSVRLKLVGELFMGSQVNVADVSTTTGTDAGVMVGRTYQRDSNNNIIGVNQNPTCLILVGGSFEIPASSTTVSANQTFSGWTTSASGSNIKFTFNSLPISTWNTTQGCLSAELVDTTQNPRTILAPDTRLKAGNYLTFQSLPLPKHPNFLTYPGPTSDTSLAIPLSSSANTVTISNVRLKVLAVRDPNNTGHIGNQGYRIFQYCPLQDGSLVPGTLLSTTTQQPTITLPDMSIASGETLKSFSVEVNDPRRCALSDAWSTCTTSGTTYPGTNTLGVKNSNWPATLPEIRAFCNVTLGTFPSSTGYYTSNPGEQGTFYSPGQLASLWTAPPYIVPTVGDLTLNLTSTDSGIPDHLALELINSQTGLTLGTNQGTINPNTRIYPASWGIPSRTKALDALFRRWRIGGINVNSSALVSSIVSNMPTDGYKYRGEIIPYLETGGGVLPGTATKSQKQALFTNLAGRLTTQSSTFGVWGVAQTVQQTPGGQIVVTGEKRFYSVIRRHPYPGIDGVYGNAQSDSSGAFIKTIAGGSGFTGPLFGLMRDTFDGPDAVPVPNPASIPVPDATNPINKVRSAYNPLKNYLTTDTAYFEYLEP